LFERLKNKGKLLKSFEFELNESVALTVCFVYWM